MKIRNDPTNIREDDPMSRLNLAVLLGAAAVLLVPRPAAAVDYIFTVPVDIRNLHPTVAAGFVVCNLRNAGGTLVGEATRQRFTLTGGSYRGDIEIRVSTRPGTPAVVSWVCSLRFTPPPAGGDLSASILSDPTHPLFREEFRRAPGSEFRPEITGRF